MGERVGVILWFNPAKGFGELLDAQGDRLFFSVKTSALVPFEKLKKGALVRTRASTLSYFKRPSCTVSEVIRESLTKRLKTHSTRKPGGNLLQET